MVGQSFPQPLNRLKLGVVVSETAKTLADLNAEADDPLFGLKPLAVVPDRDHGEAQRSD